MEHRDLIPELLSRLEAIEQKLDELREGRLAMRQSFYSTSELAVILGKAEWTVREWCRLGRVNAEKRASGRGCAKEWMIAHEELERVKSEGLLPVRAYRHIR